MHTCSPVTHSSPLQHLLSSLRDCIMSPTDPPQIILASLAQHHSPLMQCLLCRSHRLFLFNDTAPTEIYPLSLHAALPISHMSTVWMAAHSRPPQHLLASLRDCIMSPTDPQSIVLTSLPQQLTPLMYCLLCRSHRQLL